MHVAAVIVAVTRYSSRSLLAFEFETMRHFLRRDTSGSITTTANNGDYCVGMDGLPVSPGKTICQSPTDKF